MCSDGTLKKCVPYWLSVLKNYFFEVCNMFNCLIYVYFWFGKIDEYFFDSSQTSKFWFIYIRLILGILSWLTYVWSTCCIQEFKLKHMKCKWLNEDFRKATTNRVHAFHKHKKTARKWIGWFISLRGICAISWLEIYNRKISLINCLILLHLLIFITF